MPATHTKTKRTAHTKPAPVSHDQPSIPQVGPEREDEIRSGLESRKQKTPLRLVEGLTCPVCGAGVLAVADSLAVDWVQNGERTIVGNLTGFRCSNCGREFFDAQSARIISTYIDRARPRGGYSATISALGGGKLGVYFPRDLLRNLDFSKSEVVHLYPVSRKKVVIESEESAS